MNFSKNTLGINACSINQVVLAYRIVFIAFLISSSTQNTEIQSQLEHL